MPAPPVLAPTITGPALIAQITPAILAIPEGGTELRLKPEELGRLRIELVPQGDQMRVTLMAERPETLDLMRRHADQLLTDLRQAGYMGATLKFGQWQQEGHDGNGEQPSRLEVPAEEPAPLPNLPSPRSGMADSALYLRL